MQVILVHVVHDMVAVCCNHVLVVVDLLLR